MELGNILSILREHEKELRERFRVKKISVFGSCSRGEQSNLSDVDILVEFYEPLGLEFVDFIYYLESILGAKVDVITKEAAKSKPILWESIKEDLVEVW